MQQFKVGSCRGSVGGVVASDARGPRFESSHRQTFILDIYLLTVNCIEMTKRGREWPIFKKQNNSKCLPLAEHVCDNNKTFKLIFGSFTFKVTLICFTDLNAGGNINYNPQIQYNYFPGVILT